MTNVMITYGSAEGQTASISEYVNRGPGHDTGVVDAKALPGWTVLQNYEAVIV